MAGSQTRGAESSGEQAAAGRCRRRLDWLSIYLRTSLEVHPRTNGKNLAGLQTAASEADSQGQGGQVQPLFQVLGTASSQDWRAVHLPQPVGRHCLPGASSASTCPSPTYPSFPPLTSQDRISNTLKDTEPTTSVRKAFISESLKHQPHPSPWSSAPSRDLALVCQSGHGPNPSPTYTQSLLPIESHQPCPRQTLVTKRGHSIHERSA